MELLGQGKRRFFPSKVHSVQIKKSRRIVTEPLPDTPLSPAESTQIQ